MTRERPSGLYGRRKGHPLRDGQARLMEELLPRLRLPAGPIADLADLFAQPPRDLWMEIGFGGGEHLVANALAHQDIGFIGCEPFVNGMAKAVAAIDQHGIGNIRLWDEDAGVLLDRLPAASVARVYLLYPDPWPKKRHFKRRFVSPQNLDRLARVIRPGGELRFATDIPSYGDWALRHLADHPDFTWTARRADDWRIAWDGWTSTRYEQKALAAGRVPNYFIFERASADAQV